MSVVVVLWAFHACCGWQAGDVSTGAYMCVALGPRLGSSELAFPGAAASFEQCIVSLPANNIPTYTL